MQFYQRTDFSDESDEQLAVYIAVDIASGNCFLLVMTSFVNVIKCTVCLKILVIIEGDHAKC